MAEALAIVTTRGGAAGAQNRYTRSLAGTPLIAYSLRECDKAGHIQRTVMSTDSKEVARAAGLYNAKVITRPPELAGWKTPLTEIVKHALGKLKSSEGYEPDVVVVLPAEFPLRRARQVDEAIEKMEESGADSVVSVCPAEQPPYDMVRLEGDRAVPFVEEAGGRSPAYLISGAIYVLKPALVLEQGRLRGGDTRAIVMKPGDSVKVTDRHSFMRAEAIVRDRKKDIFR